MTFGEKLKQWRKEKKISQKEIGDILQVEQKQVSNYENGKSKPSLDGFVILCNLMGESADWLLMDKENEQLSTEERKLLDIYKKLEEKDKNKLMIRAEIMLEEQEENGGLIEEKEIS